MNMIATFVLVPFMLNRDQLNEFLVGHNFVRSLLIITHICHESENLL